MTRHLLASGLLAGFAVALLATLLQFAFVQKGIVLAERYESGELQHFSSAGHDHAEAAPGAHHHTTAEMPVWQRQAKTLLTLLITYCGFGLLMVAGFALTDHFGHKITPPHALLWGLAGFTAFSLAPAMGLEPTLPGVEGADLGQRQVWWLLCATTTAAGLALISYSKPMALRGAGVALLAIPHIIGAPHLAEFAGILPPELAAQHAARSLGVGLIAWVTLGAVAQHLWSRKT